MPGGRRLRETGSDSMMAGGALVIKFDGSGLLGVMNLRQTLIIVLGGAALSLVAALSWLFGRVRRLEANLDEQRALARLGTAARTLAHEVRNPLSIILMQTSLLERQTGAEHRDALESIGEEARRIESQVRKVRHIVANTEGDIVAPNPGSGLGAGDAPAFAGSPAHWLEALVGSFPGWKGRVALLPPPGGSSAEGSGSGGEGSPVRAPAIDDESLRSILANLVDNALEAYLERGEPEGKVTIEWGFAGRGRDALELKVRDEAGGVPPEERSRIFDPFFTTKPRGSGVGLNLARELARAAGGDLSYHFEKPSGSRLVVTLPLRPVPEGIERKNR